jgi:hypothetical protein
MDRVAKIAKLQAMADSTTNVQERTAFLCKIADMTKVATVARTKFIPATYPTLPRSLDIYA